MLPDAKICWFCSHAKTTFTEGKNGRSRWRQYCELSLKKVGAWSSENFNRCKGFEPEAGKISAREGELHRVIRECRTELVYLGRLSVYMEHKRRRGAEYEKCCRLFEPLFPETDKTVCADGFEQKEKRLEQGAGGKDEHI